MSKDRQRALRTKNFEEDEEAEEVAPAQCPLRLASAASGVNENNKDEEDDLKMPGAHAIPGPASADASSRTGSLGRYDSMANVTNSSTKAGSGEVPRLASMSTTSTLTTTQCDWSSAVTVGPEKGGVVSAFLVDESEKETELNSLNHRLDQIVEREVELRQRELELERRQQEQKEEERQRIMQLSIDHSYKNNGKARNSKLPGFGGRLKRTPPNTDIVNGSDPRDDISSNSQRSPRPGRSIPATSVTSGRGTNSMEAFAEAGVALLRESEVKLQSKALATGTFNTVLAIKKISLESDFPGIGYSQDDYTQDEKRNRRRLVRVLLGTDRDVHGALEEGDGGGVVKKAVLKRLRPDLDIKKQELAAKRLAYEAKLMTKLQNRHMAQVLAISSIAAVGIGEYAGDVSKVFYVIEQLNETLMYRLVKTWHKQSNKLSNTTGRPQFFKDQVRVSASLISAIEYLHSKNVVHSDIRPENIGFDGTGTLKLFNISKAKSLVSKKGGPKQPYDTSIWTKSVYHGKPPYAAPEIAAKQPCNLGIDMYAFAIVLWEIFHVKLCFGRESTKGFPNLVPEEYKERLHANQRPNIDPDIPSTIQRVMKLCWGAIPSSRPSVRVVAKELFSYQERLEEIF